MLAVEGVGEEGGEGLGFFDFLAPWEVVGWKWGGWGWRWVVYGRGRRWEVMILGRLLDCCCCGGDASTLGMEDSRYQPECFGGGQPVGRAKEGGLHCVV